MLDALIQFDRAATLLINHTSGSMADGVMIMVSDKMTWIPLYLALMFLLYKIFGWKRAAIILGFALINVAFTDQLSVLLKEHTFRLRPCHNDFMLSQLRLPDGCGGSYGFVSSHAANTMGLAVLLSLILKNRWVTASMMVYAVINSYSRVYLGKHYLFDVVGGMLLGIILAWIIYKLLLFSIRKWQL